MGRLSDVHRLSGGYEQGSGTMGKGFFLQLCPPRWLLAERLMVMVFDYFSGWFSAPLFPSLDFVQFAGNFTEELLL